MPVDLQTVDLVSLIEQNAAIRFGKAMGNGVKRTQKGGPCPFCGLGTDRFAVFLNDIPQHYFCGIHGNGCEAQGDAITFVREYLKIDDFYEACELLQVDPGSDYTGPRHRQTHTDEDPPAQKWMDRAESFCLECKATLLSNDGQRARDWLYTRGFTDATIQRAGLGLNLQEGYQDAKAWGTEKDVRVARGIVLPWSVQGDIWKVNIRRSDKDIAAENARKRANGDKEDAPKYRNIAGGTNSLYGVDTIQPGQPLILVEGEFDRLALLQEIEGTIAVVATGGTGLGREQRWIDAIRHAAPVLIAFDDDSNAAGESAAHFWLQAIPSAVRWLPWSHDINDMLTQGLSIPTWLDTGVAVAEKVLLGVCEQVPTVQTQEVETDQALALPVVQEVDTCILCGALTTDSRYEFYYVPLNETRAVCYCEKHYPGEISEAPVTSVTITNPLQSIPPEWKEAAIRELQEKIRQEEEQARMQNRSGL